MSASHDCRRCCLSRRECIKLLSLSALGASMGGRVFEAVAQERARPARTDFVDATSLRPKPEVRVAATFLEMPRPYWLGWPGTTYNLDKHQKEYSSLLAQSAQRLGVKVGLEPKPINNQEGLNAWIG